MNTLDDVTRKALALPVEERVVLAQCVWDSVGHFASFEVEKAWMDEVDRRWREIEEGKVQCLPADQVMKRARESLGR
jgi:putative addiction module component (TIGR02574 family)